MSKTVKKRQPFRIPEMIGKVFTRLTVIEYAGKNEKGVPMVLCRCQCGTEKLIYYRSLLSRNTISCGCLGAENRRIASLKHGEGYKSKEYRAWHSMIERCYDRNNNAFDNYGGRGITVCPRWLASYANFLSDVGRAPSKDHSADRYPDVNGNYELSNFRWATNFEQARNKRINVRMEHNGESLILTDWSKRLGLSMGIFYRLYRKGLSIADIMQLKNIRA